MADNLANTIIGTTANDVIHGLGGDDIIEGGAGIDQMFGDEDNDTFRFRGAYLDSGEMVDGGAGDHDKLDLSLVEYSSLNSTIQTVTSSVFVDLSQNIFGANLTVNQLGWFVGTGTVLSKVYNVEDVIGTAGRDTIIGNALNNTINGGAGIDVLSGGGGNDTFLVTGRWFDNGESYNGNAGIDTLDLSGVDYTDARYPGQLVVGAVDLAQNMVGTIVAPSGNIFATDSKVTQASVREIETVIGSKYADSMSGNAGANTLMGGDGNDELDGKDGADILQGGRGNDTIKISGTYDTVGLDTIDGGDGIDTIDFRKLTSSIGNVYARVDLATGAYSLGYDSNTGTGMMFSSTAAVNNVENFIGAVGPNWIAASSAANHIIGGLGDDLVSYEHSTAAVSIDNFARKASGGYAQGDVLDDIEDIVGSAFNDHLTGFEQVWGGKGADTFGFYGTFTLHDFKASEGDVIEFAAPSGLVDSVRGLADLTWRWLASDNAYVVGVRSTPGLEIRVMMIDRPAPVTAADVAAAFTDEMFLFTAPAKAGDIVGTASVNSLVGTAQADTMLALAGSDVLTGNGGSDLMYGGDGADTFMFSGAYRDANEVVDGGKGIDTMDFSGVSYASLPGQTGGIQVDLVAGTFGSTVITTATGVQSIVQSRVAGIENLIGSAGNDTLNGNNNDNVIDGRAGTDRMAGGFGNDTYVVDGRDSIIEDVNAGIDTVQSSVSYALAGNVENLILTGAAVIDGMGNTLANTLIGNGAANILYGAEGADIIAGGLGNDTLAGGTQADIFLFNTALNASTNRDMIWDFAAEDTIQLKNDIFTAFAKTGTIVADAFYAAAGAVSAHDASDRVVYAQSSGALYYDADGAGGAAAVQFATIANGAVLTFADFVVV